MEMNMSNFDELENTELEDRGDLIDQEEDEEDQEEDQNEEEESSDQEEEESEEDEEPEELPKKEPRIPKSRLDEVIRQREVERERSLWLESQLEKLISKQQKEEKVVEVPSYDFDKAEEDYIALILEGESAKAAKLRSEINKAQRLEVTNLIKGIEESVSTKAKYESNTLLENDKFNNLVFTLETEYPFLDSSSKSYNEEAVDTVNALAAGYAAAGKSRTDSLKMAVSKVLPLYNTVPKETKTSLGTKRTIEAGKKAAKAANSQPTKTKSVSTETIDTETIKVSKMSERDFAKLTPAQLKLLRGD